MAIGASPRQSRSDVPAGTATTIVLAFTSNVIAGTHLIVVATMSDSPSAPTCTDSLGNTYTLRAVSNNAGTNHSTMVFDAVSATGGANTVTVASNIGGVSNRTIRLYEWEGIDPTTPYVGTNVANSSTTTPSTGTVTPGVAGCLFLASMDGQATIAVDSPFSLLTSVSSTVEDDYYIQGAAAALGCTWTDGAGWSLGRLTVWAPAATGPTIDTQPTAQKVVRNYDTRTSATFTSAATGATSQNWQEEDSVAAGTYTDITNGGIYSGALTDSLVITPTSNAKNGLRYRNRYTNGSGTTYTNAVLLTVKTGPVPSATSGTTNGSGVAAPTYTTDDALDAVNGSFLRSAMTVDGVTEYTATRPAT